MNFEKIWEKYKTELKDVKTINKMMNDVKTQILAEVKEKIDIWVSNSILTFDDDSIAQTKLKDDICKYVRELKQLLSQLEDDEVKK
jgi:hypothetical protein